MSQTYALVTGASSGIGTEIARQLAAKGYSLVITARREERLRALKEEISQRHQVDVQVLAADLSERGAARTLFDQVVSLNLPVGILVNNAGVGMQGRFMEMDQETMERMMVLNMHSLTSLCQLFGRRMAQNGGGHILNVASMAAFVPSPFLSAYAASKSYVMSFGEALRFELKGTGVSLTTLYPGITTTEFNEVAHASTPGMMDASILSAEKVARVGLKAMFKRRRAVIPGKINNVVAFFGKLSPRGMLINMTGKLMAKANHQD